MNYSPHTCGHALYPPPGGTGNTRGGLWLLPQVPVYVAFASSPVFIQNTHPSPLCEIPALVCLRLKLPWIHFIPADIEVSFCLAEKVKSEPEQTVQIYSHPIPVQPFPWNKFAWRKTVLSGLLLASPHWFPVVHYPFFSPYFPLHCFHFAVILMHIFKIFWVANSLTEFEF